MKHAGNVTEPGVQGVVKKRIARTKLSTTNRAFRFRSKCVVGRSGSPWCWPCSSDLPPCILERPEAACAPSRRSDKPAPFNEFQAETSAGLAIVIASMIGLAASFLLPRKAATQTGTAPPNGRNRIGRRRNEPMHGKIRNGKLKEMPFVSKADDCSARISRMWQPMQVLLVEAVPPDQLNLCRLLCLTATR